MAATTQSRNSAPVESSFHGSLDGLDARRFTQWPSFPFQEEYKSENDRHSILSFAAASTTGFFFPTRYPLQQNSGPFNRIKRMCTRFPLRDVSWMVASSFTIGAAVFVVNGFFLLLPLVAPSTNFAGETPYATPATSLFGTFIFLVGGYVGWLEGLNLKRGGETIITEGVTIEAVEVTESEGNMKDEEKQHQSDNYTASPPEHLDQMEATRPDAVETKTNAAPTATVQLALIGSSEFIWWPTLHQFRSFYRHDLPFLSGAIQAIGAVVFAIASLTSVPGVIDFDNVVIVDAANLLPATLGGFLFFIASVIQMLIVQEKWYAPKPLQIDWHVGFWNAIGSLGFTLTGSLPFIGTSGASFQATLADFWGSWAFFIGSLVQWYIVMGNYP